MNKVYCDNCKYCYFAEYLEYSGNYCCELLETEGYNFLRKFKIDGKCESKNKDNNCRDYKRLWYKFWVK